MLASGVRQTRETCSSAGSHSRRYQGNAVWNASFLSITAGVGGRMPKPESYQRELPQTLLTPLSHSPHADIFKAHGTQTSGVEDVFGIDDERSAQQGFDLGEVEGAELRPAGAYDQRFRAFRHCVG